MNDDLLLSDCHRSKRTSGWVGCGRGKDKLTPLLSLFSGIIISNDQASN
jgi:hypothetical protein